ncbi:MAG: tetratricopeptide repeat protein, partial [Thermoanaerobaculaceae bacterium]
MATAKRDQLIEEAEKLAAKGKLNAAVEQFQKALKQGPPDGVLLNRLGDLLLKANRVEEAVEAYQKAADAYAAQGFTLKAVAAEKKANRADPQKTDTYERLAAFYYTLNMPVEGRQQLLILADWYLRSKNVGEAVRIYRQLAEREPGNFQVRAKLVDLLAGQGDLAGAGAELEQLGLVLVSRGLLDEAVRLVERCREMGLQPGKFGPALLDALRIGGRLPTALELVRKWQGSDVSPDLAVAMARVFVEAEDLRKAKELLERVLPEAGERTEVVHLYGDLLLRLGEGEAAKEQLLPTVDRLLAAGDLERAGQILKRLLKSNPRDVEILERGLKIFDRRQDAEFFAVLEATLADAYFVQGRRQEAAELYMDLARREPGNSLFQQRLQELGVRPPQAEILHRSVARPEPMLRVEEVESVSDVEMEVEIPLEELEAVGGGESLPVSAGQAEEEKSTGAQLGVKELYTEAVVLAKYGLTDKALSHLQQLLALDPNHVEGRKLLASLGGSLEVVEEPVVAPEPATPPLELTIPEPELPP